MSSLIGFPTGSTIQTNKAPETVPIKDNTTQGLNSELFDLMGKGEGTFDNYNAHYGAGKQTKTKFTEMTVNDVLSWQNNFVRQGSKSSAVGRYQIIRKTMRSLIALN